MVLLAAELEVSLERIFVHNGGRLSGATLSGWFCVVEDGRAIPAFDTSCSQNSPSRRLAAAIRLYAPLLMGRLAGPLPI